MSTCKYLGAGAALLATTTLMTTPAMAQSSPTSERSVMVVKSDWGGVRAPRPGDNDIGIMPISEYMRQFPKQGEAGFTALEVESKNACSKTGAWIQRSIKFIARADKLTERNAAVNASLVALGNKLDNAANARTGTTVIGTGLLCILSGGYYCGAAVAAGVGNEIGNRSYKGQAKLNRKQSLLNSDQSQLQLDISVLNLDMSIGWAEMVTDYCLLTHVDATIGNTTASTNTSPAAPASKRATWEE